MIEGGAVEAGTRMIGTGETGGRRREKGEETTVMTGTRLGGSRKGRLCLRGQR